MNYVHDVVHTDTGEIIALRHVESFLFGKDSEDEIINKLKGDVVIEVRTISGFEYRIYALKAYAKIQGLKDPLKNGAAELIAQAIYDRWIWLLKP